MRTKYTPPGTTVGITAAKAEAVLRVEVWDEGPGLAPSQERAIFERFARGERESAITGVGLGLAICEAIIEAHGGKIWAENREPDGARFISTRPLEEQPVVEEKEFPSAHPQIALVNYQPVFASMYKRPRFSIPVRCDPTIRWLLAKLLYRLNDGCVEDR